MSEFICNTSPMQYLHQLELLHILPELAGQILVPKAVVQELDVGKKLGLNLPELSTLDWVTVRQPSSLSALTLVINLGRGETEVLMLALESNDPIVILDDGLARWMAKTLKIRLTGTLGFRLAPMTRTEVLRMANELA